MTEIDVTPKWWAPKMCEDDAEIEGACRAMWLTSWDWRWIGDRFGDDLVRVDGYTVGTDGIVAHLEPSHGLNAEAFRGALVDRLSAPCTENFIRGEMAKAKARGLSGVPWAQQVWAMFAEKVAERHKAKSVSDI